MSPPNRYQPPSHSLQNHLHAVLAAENVPKSYPVDVPVPQGEGGLSKASVVQCNQIRTVDEARFVRTLGRLSPTTMERIDRALRISLAL
ncbi:MAG: type II toxin-antitoxin system PemK/MazF family toxin [Bryobacteraceae bacterium]